MFVVVLKKSRSAKRSELLITGEAVGAEARGIEVGMPLKGMSCTTGATSFLTLKVYELLTTVPGSAYHLSNKTLTFKFNDQATV